MDYKWFDTVRLYIKGKKNDGVYDVLPVSSDSYNYDRGIDTELEEFVSVKNGGLFGFKLKGLKKRSKSVYIISLSVDDDTYEFEMKSRYVTDMLLNGGVSSGGMLNGLYSFVRIGKETRLVCEGSDEYVKARSFYAEYRKVKKDLSRNALVPGRVYAVEDSGYGHFLYLGEVYVWERAEQAFDTMKTRKAFLILDSRDSDVAGLSSRYDLDTYEVLIEDDVFLCRDITEERGYSVVDVDELCVELIKRFDFKLVKWMYYLEKNIKSGRGVEHTFIERCWDVESTFSRTREEFERRVSLYKEFVRKEELSDRILGY